MPKFWPFRYGLGPAGPQYSFDVYSEPVLSFVASNGNFRSYRVHRTEESTKLHLQRLPTGTPLRVSTFDTVRSDAALGGQKRAREIVRATSDTEQKGSTSEENSTCSDVSFVVTETESDDTSTDEQISTEDNASNSTGSEQDDSQISRPDAQPETIEKNGVVWTSQKYELKGQGSSLHQRDDEPIRAKRRCYLCLTRLGRKVPVNPTLAPSTTRSTLSVPIIENFHTHTLNSRRNTILIKLNLN
ncbi:unnamed protein product [Adineta ricciae]|uniref:Uncharacterized protein n=1 Tax=Adineta ricciae TaxID=249248 RepID=A0A813P993_ADIRI|nr:unnamed protein product [Adineta ricciae]